MKRKRFSEEQIAFALRQAESGTTVEEICRKMGVSEPTFYRWKKVYAGMGVTEIRRLKQLEDENAKPKRVVADLTLDKAMLQDVLRKNGKARRPTRDRTPPATSLRYWRTTGLQGDRLPSIFATLQVTRRSTNRTAHPVEGSGGKADALRLSAASRVASSRRLPAEQQANPPALSRRRALHQV
jgi:putative transposase